MSKHVALALMGLLVSVGAARADIIPPQGYSNPGPQQYWRTLPPGQYQGQVYGQQRIYVRQQFRRPCLIAFMGVCAF